MGFMWSDIFNIRGGVHPKTYKEISADRPIEPMSLPKLLRIPLSQHVGGGAEPIVKKGDRVKKGQLIAVQQGSVSANIHAPTSGTIIALGRYVAPHPSGLPVSTISIRPDGREDWCELPAPLDPDAAEPKQISDRVAASGIVGLGGAAFPSAVKLNLGERYDLHTLVINGAECEPYLTCDDRLMRERAPQIIDGARIMQRALGTSQIIVAVEANKSAAIAALKEHIAAQDYTDIKVVRVPTRYPMGSAKHLAQAVTGIETPARALSAEVGIVVHNSATAFAVHEAVRHGRPLISRIVTVSGGAVRWPSNLEVLIGTPISDVFDYCGGMAKEPQKMLIGGPMMGYPIPSVRAPVIKGTNGLLALSEQEVPSDRAMPCIRCSSCVSACPCGLTPLDLYARIKSDELSSALDVGLLDCISCGSCAFVCPSNIPLVQYFNFAKGKLASNDREKHKLEETKRLTVQKEERMAKIAAEKKAAMAKRMAERKAKKAAADAKAAEAKTSKENKEAEAATS